MSNETKQYVTQLEADLRTEARVVDVLRSERDAQSVRAERAETAVRDLLTALGTHTVTLSAVIEHECFCEQADPLYRADAASSEALGVAVDDALAVLQEADR